jgi:uncharacterized protein (TIGR02246 family)
MFRPFQIATLLQALLVSAGSTGYAQSPPPSNPVDPAVLSAINEQVWIPFCESFAANDSNAFLALHTDDAVRISIDRNDVTSGRTFHDKTAQRMEHQKAAGRSATLTLRFTQRTHGDDVAFERGIYRFASQSSGFVAYGEFNVLLRKVDGRWRIALDADQESDSDAFDAARPLEDLAWE